MDNLTFIYDYDTKSSLNKPFIYYGIDGFTAQMPTDIFYTASLLST